MIVKRCTGCKGQLTYDEIRDQHDRCFSCELHDAIVVLLFNDKDLLRKAVKAVKDSEITKIENDSIIDFNSTPEEQLGIAPEAPFSRPLGVPIMFRDLRSDVQEDFVRTWDRDKREGLFDAIKQGDDIVIGYFVENGKERVV